MFTMKIIWSQIDVDDCEIKIIDGVKSYADEIIKKELKLQNEVSI